MILIVVLLSLVSCSGAGQNMNVNESSNPSNSNQAGASSVKIRQLWEQRIKQLNKESKDYPEKKLAILQAVFRETPAESVNLEREAITRSSLQYSQLSEYEQTALQSFAATDIDARASAKLIALFSAKPPRYIGAEPIELYLANSSLSEPLLLIFDSHDAATDPNAKKSLVLILGDAFKTLRAQYSDDANFLRASKQWYLAHKSQVRINTNYHPDSPFPENQQLLILSPPTDK
jgi:hypothetical protein